MPKNIEDSPVFQMLKAIRRRGARNVPSTIADIIHANLKPERQWEFRSFMATASRLLREGQEFADLVVAGYIRPAQQKSGRRPLWARDVPLEDGLKNQTTPDWTKASEVVALRDEYRRLGVLDTAEADAQLAVIAKAGKKLYEAATFLISTSNEAALDERALKEDAEDRAKSAEARAAAVEKERDEHVLQLIRNERARELAPA